MAEKSLALTGGVINSADTWVLPFVDRSHAWAIGLIFAGFTGSGALVKARAKGEDSTAWRAIPYTSRHLNGARGRRHVEGDGAHELVRCCR
jgi:hypothetical protein